jgi:hypothetical protein
VADRNELRVPLPHAQFLSIAGGDQCTATVGDGAKRPTPMQRSSS